MWNLNLFWICRLINCKPGHSVASLARSSYGWWTLTKVERSAPHSSWRKASKTCSKLQAWGYYPEPQILLPSHCIRLAIYRADSRGTAKSRKRPHATTPHEVLLWRTSANGYSETYCAFCFGIYQSVQKLNRNYNVYTYINNYVNEKFVLGKPHVTWPLKFSKRIPLTIGLPMMECPALSFRFPCIGRMLGYFWSDLEDNLQLPVIEGRTFDAHMVHCPTIFEATESIALSPFDLHVRPRSCYQIKVALKSLGCINSLVLEFGPLPRTLGSLHASFWSTFLCGASFYWGTIKIYKSPQCTCASSGIASLFTYSKIKIV